MKVLIGSMLVTALCSVSGAALARCESMNVIVRNQVWDIRGLDAFCAEFEALKAEVRTLSKKLAASERENEALRAALDAPERPPAAIAPVRR